MDMALRRRLAGVASVSISQERQHIAVSFTADAPAFAASEFRGAAAEADVDVISFEVDVCGRIERDSSAEWLIAGATRFVVTDGSAPGDRPVCVTAVLVDASAPLSLNSLRPLVGTTP